MLIKTLLLLSALTGIGLIAAGIYGFVYSLSLWGAPIIIGFIIIGGCIQKADDL